MMKKLAVLLVGLMVIMALAACSAVQANSTANNTANTNSAGATTRNQFADPSKMTVDMKLAIGTLMLEDMDQAVTADQAKNLLPLWQALKSLSTSNNTAGEEITALYTQIQETMTPAQIDAITKLTWTQDELAALREKYGLQAGFGFGPTLSTDQQATRQAQFQANGGGANGGGRGQDGGGFGGGFPPDGGGGFPPDGGGFQGGGFQGRGQGGTPQAARTPSPEQLNRQAMGFNSLFADAVIKLLETRSQP